MDPVTDNARPLFSFFGDEGGEKKKLVVLALAALGIGGLVTFKAWKNREVTQPAPVLTEERVREIALECLQGRSENGNGSEVGQQLQSFQERLQAAEKEIVELKRKDKSVQAKAILAGRQTPRTSST